MSEEIEFRSDMGVSLVESWGSDAKVAQSARVSTLGLDNDREKIEGLVKALWRDGHFSPFESSGMTVAFDVPIFTANQLVRHKSFAFSVKSLRYSEAAPKFYVPGEDRPLVQVGKALDYRREEGTALQQKNTTAIIKSNAKQSWDSYQYMINIGICDEVARSVLPTSLYTQLWMTGSLRSWLHFISQRSDKHAQYEIRQASDTAGEILSSEFPVTWEAFQSAES